MAKPRKDQDEKQRVELEPDAWSRFERFVQDIAKAGPQHRIAKPHKPREESKVESKDSSKPKKRGRAVP